MDKSEKSNLRIEILKQYLAEDPGDDFSQYALALELQQNGEYQNALYHFEKLLTRNSDYLAAYYQCGKLYESEKDFSNAARLYQKGIEVALQQNNIKTLNELRSAMEMLD